ncbi:Hydroxymethylglutaryl-CoA lyase YngG [Geobacillus sp. BCO2]|nr:Hydroxymethylglutaryl-CoA lyase YngG [Geobacillus sp. BCO2]
MSRWPAKVTVKEVGPRDGLQNEATPIATADKIAWINLLSETGLSYIEVTSFVHPKWIPQLADAVEVAEGIRRKAGVTYAALVPNEKGLSGRLAPGSMKWASSCQRAKPTTKKILTKRSLPHFRCWKRS